MNEETTLDLAYPIVLRSNELIIDRFNSLDRKLQLLISVSCAIPVLTQVKYFELSEWRIELIKGIFLGIVLLTLFAIYFLKNIAIINSKTLVDFYLDLPPEEFKSEVVTSSSNFFYENNKRLIWKWRCFGFILPPLKERMEIRE